MFSEELEKYSWEETTREIYSKTAADVELALSKSQLAIDDFMALISPAAGFPSPQFRSFRVCIQWKSTL